MKFSPWTLFTHTAHIYLQKNSFSLCNFVFIYIYIYIHTHIQIYILMHTHLYTYIYIYIYISSCHAASIELPDFPLPPFSIVHSSQLVFKAISCISTELLHIGSSWSSCLCSSMWRGPLEYVTYEFISTSPAVSYMSGSSYLESFQDGW